MENEDILKEQIKNIEESVDFFSQRNKSYREAWIVNEFLSNFNQSDDKKCLIQITGFAL